MKNGFSIFKFPIKIRNWKLKKFYHFSIFNFESKLKYLKMSFSIPIVKWKLNGTFGARIGARIKNQFSIFNFLKKTGNWKLKTFYRFSIFSFELKIETHKNVLSHFIFKLKIKWHFRLVPCVYRSCIKSSFDFQWNFLVENWILKMCKNVLLYFNFKLKIEWHFWCADSIFNSI